MSVPDLAETLGIPLGTAQSRLGRALAALRAVMQADLDTEPAAVRRGQIA
jgi:DNA-directed RNA polymerase specialized sigma24 family protein